MDCLFVTNREVRMVPKNYSHPRNQHGKFIPLFYDYNADLKKYYEEKMKWDDGYIFDYIHQCYRKKSHEDPDYTYEKYAGPPPVKSEYMDLSGSPRNHYMMFETCSEGTPISPAFKTKEELARWLADNKASVFGMQTTDYDGWMQIISRHITLIR